MIEPLRLSLDVACGVDHAFAVWTSGFGAWWPADHTATGAPERVVLETVVGGRIYERAAGGVEHEWGEVTVWEPPTRLGYLGTCAATRRCTEVEIRFVRRGAATPSRSARGGSGWVPPVRTGATATAPAGRRCCRTTWRRWRREQAMATGSGTKDDPWVLKTPPGTSEYTMHRDEGAEPPTLVCQVGSTTLKYHLRAIEDLHAFLREQGDWVPLGAADEKKPAADGTVEAWGRSQDNPVGGWYGLRNGYRGRFGDSADSHMGQISFTLPLQ